MRMDLPVRIVVLVAVALLMGASLGVFDADDGTGLDLCGAALLPVGVLVLRAPQPLVGRLAPVQTPAHAATPLEHPVPPPRA